MSYISDMAILQNGSVAVGWLQPDHPFPRATLPTEFVSRIQDFARRWGSSVAALGWCVAGGIHTCEFCDKARASGTFGVPAGNRIFYVPEMIAHYVEHHQYAPPAEFVTAVMDCPLPDTPEYRLAVAPFVVTYE
jgi:hypothetical protein